VLVVQPPAEPQRARLDSAALRYWGGSAPAFPSATSIAISEVSTSTIGSASERSPSREGRHGGTGFFTPDFFELCLIHRGAKECRYHHG
jgi:hypothetical protein